MPTPRRTKIALHETTFQTPGKPLVVEGNVVRDVKLNGLKSENGREYLQESLRDATPKYEGKPSNIDHVEEGGKPRSAKFGDRFGWFENVHYAEGDGHRGDYRFNPEHPYARTFAWWAANRPDKIGFSHNATGDGYYRADGVFVVESIDKVISIDLVADPATTRGLAESFLPTQAPPMPKTFRQLLKEGKSPHKKALTAWLKEDGMSGYGDMPMEGAVPGADEGGECGDHKADILAAISKLLDDPDPKNQDKIKKLMKILTDDGAPDEPEPIPEDDEEDMPEDKKKPVDEALALTVADLKKQLKEHKGKLDGYEVRDALAAKQTQAQALCDAARLPAAAVTPVFLESLMSAPDDKAMQRLIEDRRDLLKGLKSGAPLSALPGTGGDPKAEQAAAYNQFLESMTAAQNA